MEINKPARQIVCNKNESVRDTDDYPTKQLPITRGALVLEWAGPDRSANTVPAALGPFEAVTCCWWLTISCTGLSPWSLAPSLRPGVRLLLRLRLGPAAWLTIAAEPLREYCLRLNRTQCQFSSLPPTRLRE
eukprot:scaffold12368_cov38-Prasinocladus_malaysianus.AAC.1